MLLISIHKIKFGLFKDATQTFIEILQHMLNVLVSFLHCVNIFFYSLNKSQVFMATEFVNGCLDVFNQMLEI
jgi:hypothetical protein